MQMGELLASYNYFVVGFGAFVCISKHQRLD